MTPRSSKPCRTARLEAIAVAADAAQSRDVAASSTDGDVAQNTAADATRLRMFAEHARMLFRVNHKMSS